VNNKVKPEVKNYLVKVVGVFNVNATAENEEYAKGLVMGQITAKLPAFQIMQIEIKET